MREEQFKNIIKKSRLETSEVFVDELMHAIEEGKEVKKINPNWSFKVVLIVMIVLVVLSTFFLFKLLSNDVVFLSNRLGVHKTPIFLMVTLILLYYINSLLKLKKVI